MSKHTPGPWTYDSVREVNGFPVYRILSGDGMVGALEQCNIPGETRRELEQTLEANARLIAAAPELLEAAKNVLAALEEFGFSRNEIDLLKAAIDKAEPHP
jgi:hypothetical protein